jgi:hypothetical protein
MGIFQRERSEFERAIDFKKEFLAKHPELKSEVDDYFQLMLDECEDDCSSVSHEIDLFIGSCEELLEEEEED